MGVGNDHRRLRATDVHAGCEQAREAIALGHDLGHPPFGHTGEEALDEAVSERFGRRFRHNEQSLRVVETLERDGRGLNLTVETRDGILNHTGEGEPATLEGRIVRLVDRVVSELEARHGIEAVGHSGPSDWCFTLVTALVFAGLLWRAIAARRGR